MQALDIIQAEHRGMWRLASAMDALVRTLDATDERAASAQALVAMLDYVDSYVDTVHHPKEDEYLFPAMLAQGAAAETITRLQQEHREEPAARDALRSLARKVASTCARAEEACHPGESRDPVSSTTIAALDPGFRRNDTLSSLIAELARGVTAFTEALRSHIRQEEMHVLPVARDVLAASDWELIDAAFLDNDDPLFGEQVRAEFESLRARIVALTPAPMGLGGSPGGENTPATLAVSGSDEVVLRLSNIASHYGRIQALHGIDVEVRRGQLVALVGANGAGKTTLLRTISGVQPLSAGRIEFAGEDVTRMAPDRRVRLGICQVPEGRQVFGPMSVQDNLRLGAFTRKDEEGIAADMRRMYQLFPILEEKKALPAGTLSGGQQQMLAIARALMGRPKLLLLDEPSMGLAPLLVDEIFRVVKQLKSEGITIFLVEQNAHAALAVADMGYVIETGRTILSGPGPQLLCDPQVQAAYLGI